MAIGSVAGGALGMTLPLLSLTITIVQQADGRIHVSVAASTRFFSSFYGSCAVHNSTGIVYILYSSLLRHAPFVAVWAKTIKYIYHCMEFTTVSIC